MTQTSKLDVLHKGVFPPITIGVALLTLTFVAYQHRTNNDKQRQLDRLQTEFQAVKARQQEQDQRAEEEAQRWRVQLCKGFFPEEFNTSNGPMEVQARPYIKSWIAMLAVDLQQKDMQWLGEDNADELWKKAKEKAAKEMKAGRVLSTP